MAQLIRLFVPAAHAQSLVPALAGELGAQARLRLGRPQPLLRLDALRCLNLRLSGSLEHVRAPLALPLMPIRQFNFEKGQTQPHLVPGVDWLALGDPNGELARHLAEAVKAFGPGTEVEAIPFVRLEGPLPQTPAPGEPELLLRKNPANFNQKVWAATCSKLLTLPEERWGEVGISNTGDLVHVLEPALERLAPAKPRLIVDLGCGLGQVTRTLALRHPQARVVGYDSSAEAIEVARTAFRLPNLSFEVADLSDPLPFPPGGVDLIVSTNALPYARDQLATARHLFELLSPDGLLLNHCRIEETHHFWDFPRSALLPNNTQIFLCDWFAAAAQAGLGTEICSIPLGTAPHFFLAGQCPPFKTALEAYANPLREAGPQPFSPLMAHVLLAHSRRAAPADVSSLPLQANHLERLDNVLSALAAASKDAQYAAIVSWAVVFKSQELYPETLDFLMACLPASAPLLSLGLGQGLCGGQP